MLWTCFQPARAEDDREKNWDAISIIRQERADTFDIVTGRRKLGDREFAFKTSQEPSYRKKSRKERKSNRIKSNQIQSISKYTRKWTKIVSHGERVFHGQRFKRTNSRGKQKERRAVKKKKRKTTRVEKKKKEIARRRGKFDRNEIRSVRPLFFFFFLLFLSFFSSRNFACS